MIVRYELEAPNGPIQRREVHGSYMDQHLLPRPPILPGSFGQITSFMPMLADEFYDYIKLSG